jgi:hypothetical protein
VSSAFGRGLTESAYTVTVDDDPVICKIIEAATGLKSFSYASGGDLGREGGGVGGGFAWARSG